MHRSLSVILSNLRRWLERQQPGALVLVAPSDHLMPDPASFREAAAEGARRAALLAPTRGG